MSSTSSLWVGLMVHQKFVGSCFSPWSSVALRQLVLGAAVCLYVKGVSCSVLACIPSAVASQNHSAASGEEAEVLLFSWPWKSPSNFNNCWIYSHEICLICTAVLDWFHNAVKIHQKVLYKLLNLEPYRICNLHSLITPFCFTARICLCVIM